jgi:hypothetical protein
LIAVLGEWFRAKVMAAPSSGVNPESPAIQQSKIRPVGLETESRFSK